MRRRLGRLIFLSLVFISGIVAGVINTSRITLYVYQMDNYKKVEQQELKKKPQRLKKKQRRGIQVV